LVTRLAGVRATWEAAMPGRAERAAKLRAQFLNRCGDMIVFVMAMMVMRMMGMGQVFYRSAIAVIVPLE
jgi:hypothetical protein